MSGGESSSAAAKRRRVTVSREAGQGARGPVARPQGVAEAAPRVMRVIRYGGHERRPSPDAQPTARGRLRQHTILDFEYEQPEWHEMNRIWRFRVFQHKTFDWGLIGQLGQEQRIRELLGPRWIAALTCEWPQYAELTMEVYSTFRYDFHRFSEPDTVSFALGRTTYEMSVPQFAVAVGFYTEAEVADPGFASLLRGYYQSYHPQGIQKEQIRDSDG